MRVIVTGLVATYPVGGVAWDYLQYVQAFRALGCDVLYLEDTGRWFYDPAAQTFTPDATEAARWLDQTLAALDPALAHRWALRAPDGRLHGLDDATLERLCAATDLLLNVSGSCWLRPAYRQARVAAYVDSDPCYNQAKIAAVDAGTVDPDLQMQVDLIRRHDVFFTLAEHIGAPDCRIPPCGITWHPTRQPITLASWPVVPAGDGPFTTVMSWRIEPPAPVVAGEVYGGKDVEFERFLHLPSRAPVRLQVALSGAAPRDRIAAAGWEVVDGQAVSRTMEAYRDYLVGSRGELSVAKHAYVATRSGWFSTRSAAYLACGRPVVVQDTGFGAHVPTGAGLWAFATMDEAVEALASVARDPVRAGRHAREVAEAYFDGTSVCRRLLADAGF